MKIRDRVNLTIGFTPLLVFHHRTIAGLVSLHQQPILGSLLVLKVWYLQVASY
jgi:hypothetical protein